MKTSEFPIIRLLLNNGLSDWAKLFLRLFFGIMMLMHGLDKIEQFNVLRHTFPPTMGMSSELSLIAIIAVEFGCSLLVVCGILTRLTVIPLIFAMTIAAFFTVTPVTMATAELPLLYWGGFLTILLLGPGRYSADYLFAGFLGLNGRSCSKAYA